MSFMVWSPDEKVKAATRQFAFSVGTKNVLITKKLHGTLIKTLWGIELGISTVFLKKQRWKQKKLISVDIPSNYSNQFVAAEKK